MANFAVLENNKVINIIVAESKDSAEFYTGKVCIEYTTEPAEPGGTYENNRFIKAQPFLSWVLDDNYEWQAPVSYPIQEDTENPKYYSWDEETISWKEITK